MSIISHHASLSSPTHYLSLQCHHLQNPVLFLKRSSKRNRYAFGRSSKLMIESAYIIASKLGVLPAPLDLILRDQFGGGSGSGSGSGNGFGFGWNGDGGKRKRRRTKMGFLGVWVLVCGVGLWVLGGKELVLGCDVLLGGLGLVLFGGSVGGWSNGGKDWVLGFLCCGFLMGLVLKREEFRSCVGTTLNLKKNGRRRGRRKLRIF